MKGISDAEIFAKEKHEHQTRDDDETPYWKHLEKVVENLRKLRITDESILSTGLVTSFNRANFGHILSSKNYKFKHVGV